MILTNNFFTEQGNSNCRIKSPTKLRSSSKHIAKSFYHRQGGLKYIKYEWRNH